MKKITAFLFAVITAIFFTYYTAFPSATVYAVFSYPAAAVMNDSDASTGGGELSIPQNIGTQIPATEKSIPIIGLIMWAIVAVAVITALIVIFANLGGADASPDASVRRNRYQKKHPKKSKLLHDRYYRK